MRISVTVHGTLRQTSTIGQDEFILSLPDTGSLRIRDLLETFNILEEEIRHITLNGRRVRLDTNLRHRVRIEFFPKEHRRGRPHRSPA